MPLPTPVANRTPIHQRHVRYHSFKRPDGLWDIEGELVDTKSYPITHANGNTCQPGDPIHHMWIRASVDANLVVHHIEVSMDAFPVDNCPGALAAMQKMVGCCMARGWRKAIEANLQGAAGCTHMRELLNNMATAAFQSIFEAFSSDADPSTPPTFLARCTGWDSNGPAVAKFFPQFVGFEWPQKPAAKPKP